MQAQQNVVQNKIIRGDFYDELPKIRTKTIDMILTDLPYNVTRMEWDNSINLMEMWNLFRHVLKNSGVVVLTARQPFTSKLVLSNSDLFREELIWLKNRAGNGFKTNQKHISIHENIIIFSPNTKYIFNPQKWLVDKREFLTQRKTFHEKVFNNNIYNKITKMRPDDTTDVRNPLSIISCRVPFTQDKARKYDQDVDIRLHPTQKPLELFEYLIKTYTSEGDLVLDCCAGSGTTAIACLKTNRKYICIEKNEEYFKVMQDRIAEYNTEFPKGLADE